MSKIKHWKKGTGSYKIDEINIKQGELIDSWTNSGPYPFETFISSGKNIISAINDGGAFGNCYNLISAISGKKYKISFNLINNGGTLPILISGNAQGGGNSNSRNLEYNCVEGYNEIEFITKYTRTEYIQFLTNDSVATDFSINDWSLTEIPPLPELDNGTKYLENTTPGTTALQSKQAYGEWEFDVYKEGSNNVLMTHLIQDSKSINNGYRFLLNYDEKIYFSRITSGNPTTLFSTPISYINNHIWYTIKVARLQSEGVFKDIPTLQTSDLVNSNGYPYTSFTSNGRYGFRAISDGSGISGAGTTKNISFDNNTKYLVEFNAKINNGVVPTVRLATSLLGTTISNIENVRDGKNSFIFETTQSDIGVIQFANVNTVADYEISGLTIRRIYDPDTFAVFIKGGDFGDDWTIIDTTGGSGTNPVKDSTYKTSNYFVADLDAGDRLANLKIYDGVEQ